MDIDVSGWILEFILRQNSIDNRSLNDLIRVLPLPNNNPRLKKSLILRKIDSDVKKCRISTHTFEFLEQIEELDIREGNAEVSEAMKAAYCSVAMHCTVNFFEQSSGDDNEEYARAVTRMWRGRIRAMEMSDVAKKAGLSKDDLLRWMHDIEAGLWDIDVCESVLARFKSLDVLEVLGRYVNEAKEKMGPSFLEQACETILSDTELSKMMGLDEGAELNDQMEDCPITGQDVDANTNNKDKEASREHVLPNHKHVTTRCPRGPGHETHRGAKIVDPMETYCKKHKGIPTPEVDKVQKALETSFSALHAMVKDPLPDALRFAESLKTSTSGENMVHDHVVGHLKRVNVDASSSLHDRNHEAPEANEDDAIRKDQNKRPKPSIMERNITAHTVEWSDSIDSSEDGSPIRPRLSSPEVGPVSPLHIYKAKRRRRRSKIKMWSNLEEDTLRTGVQKYGTGNWKLILTMYPDIFVDRTSNDLRDKWRNLTRW